MPFKDFDNFISARREYLRSIKDLQINDNLDTRSIAKLLTGCDDDVIDMMCAFTNHEPVIVPYYADDGDSRKCHLNAERTAKKLKGIVVKGWMMFQYLRLLDENQDEFKIKMLEADVSEFTQHVIVKIPGGGYLDPTPAPNWKNPLGVLRVFWPDDRVLTQHAKSYVKNKFTGSIGFGENIVHIPKNSKWFKEKFNNPAIQNVIEGTLSNVTSSKLPDEIQDPIIKKMKESWEVFYNN